MWFFNFLHTSGCVLISIDWTKMNIRIFWYVTLLSLGYKWWICEIFSLALILFKVSLVVLCTITWVFAEIHLQRLISLKLLYINTVLTYTDFIKLMFFINSNKFIHFLRKIVISFLFLIFLIVWILIFSVYWRRFKTSIISTLRPPCSDRIARPKHSK